MMPNPLHRAARQYADRGWSVLPLHSLSLDGSCTCSRGPDCASPGKHPRLEDGVKGASRDPVVIDGWWERWPDAHLGVATGAPSGVWVLDVDTGDDVDGAADLARLEAAHGALSALRARTGSGGQHLFFAFDERAGELRNRARLKIAGQKTGLDVRATGGYVVAAPSGHVSGGRYEWIHRQVPEPAPGWLLDLLLAPAPVSPPSLPLLASAPSDDRQGKYLARVLQDQAERILSAPVGGRHPAIVAAAHKVGMYLHHWPTFEQDAVVLALIDAACAAGKDRADAERAVRQMVAVGQGHPKSIDWKAPPSRDDDDAPLPEEPPPFEQEAPRRPRILVTGRQLREVVADAWRALDRANRPTPRLYRRGGALVEVHQTEQGPRIVSVTANALLGHLAGAADWIKTRRAHAGEATASPFVEVDADRPPQAVVDVLLSQPDERLPVLEGLVAGPVVDAQGRIVDRPGYSDSARVLYVGQPLQLVEGPAPEAARLLLDHWLGDFPWASDSDRAHALALVLTPFLRRLIAGPCPGFLIEAPTPGSGKSLLAELAGTVALGAAPPPTPFARQEEERRKALLSALSSGRPMILLDNVSGAVADSTLEGILTAYPAWTDRDLGRIAELTVPALSVFALTSNNATLSTDMARRVCRIRLNPATDRPGERSGFRMPDIRAWTREHRGLLVSAALSIIRAWMAAGRPYDGARLGSFERFSEVVGGCLQVAQVAGFLGDRDALFRESDREGSEWAELVGLWWTRCQGQNVSSGELLTIADDAGLLTWATGDGSDKARATRLGLGLRRMRDRVWTLPGVGRVTLTGPHLSAGRSQYRLLALDLQRSGQVVPLHV
jgi:hypothetical protein